MPAKGANGVGRFSVELEVANYGDITLLQRGLLPPDQVRREMIQGVVDSGATKLVLPEAVVKRLGLPLGAKVKVKTLTAAGPSAKRPKESLSNFWAAMAHSQRSANRNGRRRSLARSFSRISTCLWTAQPSGSFRAIPAARSMKSSKRPLHCPFGFGDRVVSGRRRRPFARCGLGRWREIGVGSSFKPGPPGPTVGRYRCPRG